MGKYTFIILLTLFSSCSLFKDNKTREASFSVNKDAVLQLSSKEVEVKENQAIDLPKESFLVRSAGNIPVYVVPLNSSFRETKVNLVPFDSSELTDTFKNSINSTLSESLFDIHEIQNEIFNKRYNRALSLINAAENKYGKISFLSYMKASVFFLTGNKARSKQILRSTESSGKSKEKIDSFLKEIE